MRKIFFYLTMPFRINYWTNLDPYNEEWDKKLRQLLDDNEFVVIDSYRAKLDDNVLWTENQPYACFTNRISLTKNYNITVRPSRYTAYLAIKKLNKAVNLLKKQAEKRF